MSTITKMFGSFIKVLVKHSAFVVLLYKIVLDLMYYYVISDSYAYITGGKEPIGWKYALGWLFFFMLIFLCGKLKNRDLHFSINFLVVLSAIPSITVFWVRNGDLIAFLLTMLFWMIMVCGGNLLSRTTYGSNSLYADSEFIPKANNPVVMFCFVFLIVTTLYYSYRFGNFRLFVSFSEVYNYRMDTSNYMGTLDAYIFSWNTNLLLPLLLIVHLSNKKYLLVITDITLGMMSYAIYGNKFVVFQIMYVVGIWVVNRFDVEKFANSVVALTLILASVLSMIFKDRNAGQWGIGLLYRLLFIPTEAHYYYYDFFQSNQYLYLRQSFLRRFFDDPYDNPVSVIIGSSTKYNHTGNYNNLNNGLFSDAYANFGFWGVVVFPILICVVVLIYSKSMRRFDATIRKAILITYLGQIISASFFQSILTGGMIVGIIIVYWIGKSSEVSISEIARSSYC